MPMQFSNDKVTLKRFGEKVRALRRDRGLVQEALARASGLDRTYVSRIEGSELICSTQYCTPVSKIRTPPPSATVCRNAFG